jgi:hypothetical protein
MTVFEKLFYRFSNTLCGSVAKFFSQFFEPTYFAVDGATEHVAEGRPILPAGADELLAALRASYSN